MSEKLKVKEVIVVEGRYDKNTLSQIVDGTIIETQGFGIFSDRKKLGLLRSLADKRGLIIMTDSDGGGFLIRNFLKGSIDPSKVKHAYIPDIPGRERRKSAPSKEGKLGVEGMDRETILNALRTAGVSLEAGPDSPGEGEQITKIDLYSLGLSGGPDSRERRLTLLKSLGLPEKLSANALIAILNALMTRSEFMSYVEKHRKMSQQDKNM